MSELAAAISLKAAATSGLIDRMEKKELLERRPAAKDGRSFELFLKPAGRLIVQDSKTLIEESNRALLEGFDDQKRSDIADFLKTITARANALGGNKETENKG